jgi:hypothetical protein
MISFVIPSSGRPERDKGLIIGIDAILMSDLPVSEILIIGGPPHRMQFPSIVKVIETRYETKNHLIGAKLNIGCIEAENEIVFWHHDDMCVHETIGHYLPRFISWIEANSDYVENWDIIMPDFVKLPAGSYFRGLQVQRENREHPLWTIGGPEGHRPISRYEPWDEYCYTSGECMIIKKSFWRTCRWEDDNDHRNTRGTAKAYDVVFGHKANRCGVRVLFDPWTRMYCLDGAS